MSEVSYRGDPKLKKPGVEIEITPEQAVEVNKCRKDPMYLATTYMHIINVDRGKIKYEPYKYQKNLITSFHHNRNTICTAARQSGKTTAVVGYLLWYILFNDNKQVVILANKGSTARKILKRLQISYKELPMWLQQGVVEWNKSAVELENETTIFADSTASDAVRGDSINILYLDETAFIENWDDFSKSVLPTISSGMSTKIFMISTPHGLNHFYAYWNGAKEKRNGYYPIEVNWRDVPGRDEAWKKKVLYDDFNGDLAAFAQEYENEFMGSSGTLINGPTLKAMVGLNPIAITEDKSLKQYFVPEEGHNYILVADVGEGRGLDYSSFQVIDVTQVPYVQVATYRNNKISTIDFSEIINRIGKFYNNAFVLIETNAIGGQVADTVHMDYEYENILFTETKGRSGKQLSAGFGGGTSEAGVKTTITVKRIGCSMLKSIAESNKIRIVDYGTIEELSVFSKKGKSYEAENGHHDDLVMPLVIFAWATDQKYFKELTDIDIVHALREKSQEQYEEELIPFGIIDTGHNPEVHEEVIDLTANPEWWIPEYRGF